MSHNIAHRMSRMAQLIPDQRAVVFPHKRDRKGNYSYSQLTFRELDENSDRLARGLNRMGITRGTRLVLMVKPGLEFITLTFAIFKTGAVIVLIDPGMGPRNVFRCLESIKPEGFVAIPIVQAMRILKKRSYPNAQWNVTIGRRWFWGGETYSSLLRLGEEERSLPDVSADDPAAIIFTSGSTGPAKGVLYEHGMFNAQVDLLGGFYGIEQGEIDLSGFPLFALFNSALGVTTVIPDMDATKPASVDPKNIVRIIRDQKATQAFGSPALWNRVGKYCKEKELRLPTLKRVLSAGAPVPLHVLKSMRATFSNPETDIHTPYGATESLPVCSISGRRVLEETAQQSRTGAGTCVGKPFPQVQVKVVEITEGPIENLADVKILPTGKIGEIIVQGPSTTKEYYLNPLATQIAKIKDDSRFWHRMGDVGYFDSIGDLWFCGRKSHIVETERGVMFTIPCEAIFNEHSLVFRTALVGVGEKPNQIPVMIVEPEPGEFPQNSESMNDLCNELLAMGKQSSLTQHIETILVRPSLPVDVRHNVKISREKLSVWAEDRLAS